MDEGDEEAEKEEDGVKGRREGRKGGIRNEENDVEEQTRLDDRGMLRRGEDMMRARRAWGRGKETQEQKEKWSLRRLRSEGGQRGGATMPVVHVCPS